MRRAKALTPGGAAELAAIAARHPFIAGDFDERDLFSSYSTGVRYVSGDPEPMKRITDPQKRIELARTLQADWDPGAQHNWSAYCSSDPEGALAALRGAPLTLENAGLWKDLVGALSWAPQNEAVPAKRMRLTVTRQIFDHLEGADPALLDAICRNLVYLLEQGRAARLATIDAWWDRLWASSERVEDGEISDETADRFYDHVINSAGGRLAEQLIGDIDKRKTNSRKISPENRARLRLVMGSDTTAGWLARGACTAQVGFLFFVDPKGVKAVLKPWLARDDRQGAMLRGVLVEWSRLGEKIELVLKNEILRGAQENQASGVMATHVANRLVRPLFLRAVGTAASSITDDDVRRLLKQAAPSVLDALLQEMVDWVMKSGPKLENAWRKAIGPIFESIWPKERTFRSTLYTKNLAALAIAAGPAFPDAFEIVRHYLLPFENGWNGLHFLINSPVVASHPKHALELLWVLCGPGCESDVWQLNEALKKIAEADDGLVRDRRFQWLEQRAPNHG